MREERGKGKGGEELLASSDLALTNVGEVVESIEVETQDNIRHMWVTRGKCPLPQIPQREGW